MTSRLRSSQPNFRPYGATLWLDASRVRIGAAQCVSARSESLSNATAIVTSGNFSVDAYIYLDTIAADMVIFDQGTAAASKQLLRVESDDSKVYFSMDGGVTNSLSAALSTGTWYHVVGTYDGTNQKLYVNGALADTDAVTVDYTGVDRFAIGSTTAGASYMNGRICLVRVWSKEVVQAEVTSLYNSGRGLNHAQLSGTLLTSLVDSYNLSEASGNRADSAGAKTLTDNNTVMCAPGIIPVIPADGVAIGIWDDLTGNGNYATQATEANMPTIQTAELAGKAVLRFDGSNDYLATAAFGAALSQPNTIIVVGKGGAAGQSLVDGIDANNRHQFRIEVGDIFRIFAGTALDDDAALTLSNFYIFSGVFNGASSASYLNGAPAASGAANTQALAGLTIGAAFTGANDLLAGDIAEVLIYNRALTAGELNRLHLYLGRKYGIGVS